MKTILSMRVLEKDLQNQNGRVNVDIQTVINVLFFFTYVVPTVCMIGLLIYGISSDINNGHGVRCVDVFLFLLSAICPILNCYVAVEIIKELR